MKKTVFTFTIDGVKYTFNTVKEMVDAKRNKEAQGIKLDEHSIKREEIELKGKSNISFRKSEEENIYGEVISRVLIVDVEVKSTDDSSAKQLLDVIRDNMDYDWFYCTETENNSSMDSFSIEFEYGQMASLKKEIMEAYKEAKKLI